MSPVSYNIIHTVITIDVADHPNYIEWMRLYLEHSLKLYHAVQNL